MCVDFAGLIAFMVFVAFVSFIAGFVSCAAQRQGGE